VNSTTQRLRAYLRTLPQPVQTRLLAELEKRQRGGDSDITNGLIALELRRLLRGAGFSGQYVTNPSRLFFKPLEPYLIGRPSKNEPLGCIHRASLRPIWLWVCRDLMPVEAKAYSDAAKRALAADDMAAAENCARTFQRRAVLVIGKSLARRDGEESISDRLAGYMAPPSAIDDLRAMIAVLSAALTPASVPPADE
jgi:hypothetical protein